MEIPSIDRFSNERKKEFGACATCNEYNTNHLWCQSCDTILLTQGWTSGNEAIDELIKSTQLEATTYGNHDYLQWIPFEDFKEIEQIGRGGFSTVYKAIWINGQKYTNNGKRLSRNRIIALKKLDNSQNISNEFLNEFKNYVTCRRSSHVIDVYGITQHSTTRDYIFVVKYLADGSLSDYLSKNFENLKWKNKINILYKIINGLCDIHQQNIIHRDFHGGNILQEKYTNTSYVADLGLSYSANQKQEDCIYGVLPYLAPEVLNNKPYTMESDIYSFGVLMTLISTGMQPFRNFAHDIYLAVKICEGLRPGFSNNTPKFFIELAHKCMDAYPNKRPNAKQLKEIISCWRDAINYKKGRYFQERFKPIKIFFDKMDETPIDSSSITATVDPNSVYISRLLRFANLGEPINSYDAFISNSMDSQQIDLFIPDNFLSEI